MAPAADRKMVAVVSGNNSGPLTFHKQKVMVKIIAPEMKTDTGDLDMVAVMDVSGSMEGTRLELMKRAMKHLIGKMKPEDRLALVPFHSGIGLDPKSKLLNLTYMKPHDKTYFSDKVGELKAGGGTNIEAGLDKAISILEGRTDSDSRAAYIFLMSDGEQNHGDAKAILKLPDFTVHTFGLGKGHDELVLSEIAYRSNSGVYSNVPDDNFELVQTMSAMQGLCRTVTVLNVKVKLTPVNQATEEPQVKAKGQEVGSISVDAGYYRVTDGDHGSRIITFGDLARGENRRIIVDMPFHGITTKIKEEPVLKVECFYRLPREMPESLPQVTEYVKLAREEHADQYKMLPEVKRELVRRQQAEYLRVVKGWTDKGVGSLLEARREVEKAREALDEYFQETEDPDLKKELYQELENLRYLLVRNANDAEYIKFCGAYVLACLSSHGRQRFAGRGGKQGQNQGQAWFYLTARMIKYINEAKKMFP